MMCFFTLAGTLLTVVTLSWGQEFCPITSGTIRLNPDIQIVRDVSHLLLIIDGKISGGTPSSVTWYRNGSIITDSTEIQDGSFSINTDIISDTPCLTRLSGTRLNINGRLPGNYTFRATNDDTSTPLVLSLIIPESNPVSNLILRQVDGMKVEASWTPPPNDVVDYRAFVNNDNVNGNGRIIQNTSSSFITLNEFDVDERVTIHVRATTTYYWSDPEHRSIKVRAMLSPTISPIARTEDIRLYIAQPRGSLDADVYYVTLTSNACDLNIIVNASIGKHRVEFLDLYSGISYTIDVIAVNNNTGLISNATTTVYTQDTAPSASPGVPQVEMISSTAITLNWTAVSCEEQNGVITNYAILYGQELAQHTVIFITVNTSSAVRVFTVTDLLPFTNYNFQVAAINSAGPGPFSNSTGIVRTKEEIPSGAPGTPRVSAKTSTSITLTWTVIPPSEENGNIIYYIIKYGQGTQQNLMINTTTTSTTYEVTGLLIFTGYTFSVAAVNGAGVGPFSESSNLTKTEESAPTAVRNLTAYPRYTNMLLDWLEPEPSNGIITNYTILYTVDEMEDYNDTSLTTRFTIEDLEPDTLLSNIMVLASTAVGPGPAVTLPYNVSTLLRPIPVINLKVEVLSSLSVNVTWNRLDNEDITHYTIYFEWRIGQGVEVGPVDVQIPATEDYWVFENLIIGGEYTFEIQARIVTDGEISVGPSSKRVTVTIATATTTTSTSSKLEGRVYTAVVLAVLAIDTTMDLYTMMLACFGAAGWMMRRHKDKYVNIISENFEGEPAEQPVLLLCQ